jgi:hypothetical protein
MAMTIDQLEAKIKQLEIQVSQHKHNWLWKWWPRIKAADIDWSVWWWSVSEWWDIWWTLSNQTDLQNALDLKADSSDINPYWRDSNGYFKLPVWTNMFT